MFRTSLAPKRLVTYSAFALLTISLAFSSCKKEDDPEIPITPPVVTNAYSFPMTDGSYWVYQQERTDSDGVVVQAGAIDSLYVEGDTVIGATTYKKIRTITSSGSQFFPAQGLAICRDSAGYMVGPLGSYIDFYNFTDTLNYHDYSGMINAWYFMRHRDSSVTVPAGTFTTIDYEGHLYATDPNYPWSTLRHTHQVFADGVGKIVDILYFYSSPDYIQRRLIRYHIQ